MSVNTSDAARTHDDVLEEIARALDIPPSKFEEAKNRYEALGEWLDRDQSTLAGYQPEISPQGSFLLGTVTRPITETDEYDVDLVCRLSAEKTEFTQKSLKQAVGYEVGLYAEAQGMLNAPEEGRRCWTLHYADGAQFHMDILPALPDARRYQGALKSHGHALLAENYALTAHAIAITDRTLPQYSQVTEDWPQSNPKGYAAWFRQRMASQLRERKMAFADRHGVTASIDDIPDHKVKTPLQRAIQLLKRHRDCMFAENGEHKPISIIITTLAAHAYNNEARISDALQTILTGMTRYIEEKDGEVWVANPVNPLENFADKWAEEPAKRESFERWLRQAQKDFALYLRASRFDGIPGELRRHLGTGIVDKIMRNVSSACATGAAVSGNGDRRVAEAIQDMKRTGTQSRPWARR